MFVVLGDPAIYEFENEPPPSEAWLAQRFAKLESRASADGDEQWLNWVVRLPGGSLAGYVQATVLLSGEALIAYVLASRFWRRGIGSAAVAAMLHELQTRYGVHSCLAVLKKANYRSLALLKHLGFTQATHERSASAGAEPDEVVMVKRVGPSASAA
jgi:RimJ/RimL family protein N-acetyltransferase